MTNPIATFFDQYQENWVLGVMLLLLHLALQAGLSSPLSASLIMAHLGVFFIWQPIWQRDQRLDFNSAALILVFACAFVILWSPAVLFAWLIVLVGIVAGRSFLTRREHYVYMLVLAFLICELLINCVPRLFRLSQVVAPIDTFFRYAFYLSPLALILFPFDSGAHRQAFPIDFFRGVTIALMTALLAISSVVMTIQSVFDYPTALSVSLLALAAFLVVISWLLSPSTGNNLGSLWEKSLLNIGTPFEVWISALAQLAETKNSPHAFLDGAVEELVRTPWVAGAAVQSQSGKRLYGDETGYDVTVTTPNVRLTLFSTRSVGAALRVHCRLLVQILGHFYTAKLREKEQATAARLKAVHETGARITHDIKNMLQSFSLLAAPAPGGADERQERERLRLLERQLPQLSQRLERALDKLKLPALTAAETSAFDAWWQSLRQRYDGEDIEFRNDIATTAVVVKGDALDGVIDNLIDNARQKSQVEADVHIVVHRRRHDGDICIEVSDSGAPIDDSLLEGLFDGILPSKTGFGIGLYQADKQAEAAGFRLSLVENRVGAVRFELRQVLAAPGAKIETQQIS